MLRQRGLSAVAEVRGIVSRIRRPPGGEIEMARNRLLFGCLGVVFLAWRDPARVAPPLLLLVAYVTVSIAILGHILRKPGAHRTRRLVALLADAATLSYELHMGGEPESLFFCLYLWMVFGNGFRFGVRWLFLATAAACLGFLAVCLTTPFWLEQRHLAEGLMAGLIALPLYAATLIRRLSQARLAAEQATQVAEEASRAKTLFMASVSHELRTPLTAIIGMGSLLRDTALEPEQREMMQTVEDAAHSLLSLINGVLDFSRIEAGRMPVQPVAFEPAELVREMRSLVMGQARAKGIRIDVNVTPRTPRRILASRRHLSDIVTNLLGNAVKFTGAGGVLIALDVEGTPDSGDSGLRLVLEVCDTGIGISPDAQRRVFETFTQADASILNDYGGTGLGLSIARSRAELLGGSLELQSEVGVGSTFRLVVPVGAVEDLPSAPPGDVAVVLLAAPGTGRRHLVGQLGACGIVCQVGGDADTALSLLAATACEQEGPAILMVLEDGLPGTLEGLQPRLAASCARAGAVAVLVGDSHAEDGDRRRHFVSVLPRDPGAADLAAALHVARTASGSRPASAASVAAARDEEGGRALYVLVADDNSVNQKVVAKILDRAGHRTRVVSDGEATLDALESGEAFDLVLMDVNMPGMDGLEVTKLYRFMVLGDVHLPIVALTADATPEMAARCAAAGMDACVTKPIAPDDLVALVERLALAPAGRPGAVVPISRHPKYRGTSAETIDASKLQTLQELGGAEFVSDLVADFLAESQQTIGHLIEAATRGDIVAFRSHAHALRSASSNIGAHALGELCNPWQHARLVDLAEQAPLVSRRARSEFERTRVALLGAQAPPRGSVAQPN